MLPSLDDEESKVATINRFGRRHVADPWPYPAPTIPITPSHHSYAAMSGRSSSLAG